ncbi:MAG: hypothetical protein E7166_04680 [Firmicutes bacterium]|nr:hypothetical protein [Bacillota bacterium]
MFKTQKYDIKNFYVGELYISTRINRPLGTPDKEITKENKIKYDIQNKTTMNGAISINDHFHLSKNNRWYNGFLTIFYKINNNYICLHNGNTYRLNSEDFCENLFRLDSLLPKISYNCPKEISNKAALRMFKQLFDIEYEYKIEKFYTGESYKLDDFYVGNLALCCKSNSKELEERRSKNINTPQKYMLNKSDAYLSSISGTIADENNVEYDYLHFYTLFLKQKKGLYNLHNFQVYNSGILDKEHFNNYKLNESYYDWMVPLREVLEENKIKYDLDNINIPKALKLYRKIK